MTEVAEQSVESLLASTEIGVSDLMTVFQQRDAQARSDLAVRDALILRQQRELVQAREIIVQIQGQLEAIATIEAATAGPAVPPRAERRAAAKRTPAKKTTAKKATKR